MVQHCFVCSRTRALHPDLSYHRFPLDDERRQKWLIGLKLGIGIALPRNALVCSVHFSSNDFLPMLSDRRYLKKEAIPEAIFLQGLVSESIELTAMMNRPGPWRWTEDEEKSDRTLSNIESLSAEEGEEEFISDPRSDRLAMLHSKPRGSSVFENTESSSSTLTAQSTEDLLIQNIYKDNSEALAAEASDPISKFRGSLKSIQEPQKRKKYVLDLSNEVFDTPSKRKRNLNIIKGLHRRQQKKIHLLEDTIWNIRKRITELKSLIS